MMVDRPSMPPKRIFPTPQPVVQPGSTPKKSAQASQTTASFQSILEQKLTPTLRFSKHAEQRLQTRQISLSEGDLTRLTQAVDKAAQKGAKDSLILMNQAAFVVNIPNRIVVTAVDGASLKENVFTNIDSAVIVD